MKTPEQAAILIMVVMSFLISCSKSDSEGHSAGRSTAAPKKIAEAQSTMGEPGLEQAKAQGVTKATERMSTDREERVRSLVRSLDDLEVQRRKLEQAEAEGRANINQLRGVPRDSEIDIETNAGARKGASEAEQKALDAYLPVALELQTIQAKEKIFSEQLERARAVGATR